jgi:hypothetical protein
MTILIVFVSRVFSNPFSCSFLVKFPILSKKDRFCALIKTIDRLNKTKKFWNIEKCLYILMMLFFNTRIKEENIYGEKSVLNDQILWVNLILHPLYIPKLNIEIFQKS